MKTIKLLFFTILISFSVNAQITKGFWMMGGNASWDFKEELKALQDGSSAKSSLLTISPDFGYFIIDKLALGVKGQIISVNVKYNEGVNITNYSIGPFIRYYFLDGKKLINVFAETSFLYGIDHHPKDEGIYDSFNTNIYKYTGMAGASFFLNDSVSIDLSFEFTRTNLEGDIRHNDIILGVGFQIFLEKK